MRIVRKKLGNEQWATEIQKPKTTIFYLNPYDKENVFIKDQKLFLFSVYMLLYLVKHSRLDIANATHELSNVNEH